MRYKHGGILPTAYVPTRQRSDTLVATKYRRADIPKWTMLESLPLIAILFFLFWLLIFFLYFRVSRQQRDLQQEIDALRNRLQESREDE